MRTFTDGSGSDSTAAAIAYVQGTATPLLADLIEIKTAVQGAPWSKDLMLTPSSHPLSWGTRTFVQANIQRGSVESKIGLEVISVEFDWFVTDDLMYGSMTIREAFGWGLFDNAMVSVWRLLMPTFGDGDTLGACELFTGRLASHSLTRLGVHFTVNSATELFDQQLPPNLIEPSNPQARYGTGQPPKSCASVPVFAAATGSTQSAVLLDEVAPNASEVFVDDEFDFGYILGVTGDNTGIFRTIRKSNSAFGSNRFYLYEPLPFPVSAGDTFNGYVPYVRAASESVTETHSVPATSPYTITVTGAGSWVGDGGVIYHGGAALTKVAANPTVGEYAVDFAGTYYFAAGDASTSVDITYRSRLAGYTGFPFVPPPEASL